MSAIVPALTSALLHSLWQFTALAAIAWALARAAERPQTKAAVHLAALLAMPLCFGSTLWVALGHAVPVPAAAALAPPTTDPRGWICAVWLTGAALMSLRSGGGAWIAWHRARGARPAPGEIRARAQRLMRAMGLRARVCVRVSERAGTAFVVGLVRHVVVLPAAALLHLDPAHLDAILAHELAHIRRHDFAVSVVQAVAEALFFYHPAVWIVSAGIRREREFACDDEAARLLDDRAVLARALVELETLRRNPALAPAATGGPLMTRIQRLLTPQPARSRFSRWIATAMVLLVTVGSAALFVQRSAARRDDGASQTLPVWMPPAVDPWWPQIQAAATAHDVDPRLLAMMMLLESGGDPDAQSPTGAVGLMQVMPQTAERIARTRGIADYDLTDPDQNLDFAAWYLARMFRTFEQPGQSEDDTVHFAVTAYNSGPRSLQAHLAGGADLSRESQRYGQTLSALWADRDAPASSAYADWRRGARLRFRARSVSPVTGARTTLSFGDHDHPILHHPYHHDGIDLAAAPGTEVDAPQSGVVVLASEHVPDHPAWGTTVILHHASGIETRFHHLDSVRVAPGDAVEPGTPIGTVGTTGVSTGPHLHYEIRDLGAPIDPAPFLGPAR